MRRMVTSRRNGARVSIPLLALLLGCELTSCGGGKPLIGSATTYARRAAYRGNSTDPAAFYLYSVDYNGTRRDLTPPLTAGGNVQEFAWSSDLRHIAFIADAFVNNFNQLFVADTENGQLLDLAPNLTPFGNLFLFEWAPDGSRVAYLGESAAIGAVDLMTVRPDGTGTVRINAPFVTGQFVSRLQWSPDSTRIAFAANQDSMTTRELYVGPADGSSPSVRVSGPMVPGGALAPDFVSFAWSPDSSRIAYRADQEQDALVELFVSTPDGLSNVRVSGALNANLEQFEWAPNSSRIAYLADQDSPLQVELYTVLPDGTDGLRASAAPMPNSNVSAFQWSPLSNRLVYRADQDVLNQQWLYSVAPTGGAVATLSGTVFDAGVGDFDVAPDGSRVAYLARQDNIFNPELYTVRLDGTQNLRVSEEFTIDGFVESFLWNPSSASLAYRANIDNQNVFEIHVTGAMGGSVRVTGPSQSNQSVISYDWSSDGSTVVYIAPQAATGVPELYRADVAGSQKKLSGTQVAGGSVEAFEQPGRD